MSYVWMALVGFVVGLIARAILPGTQSLGIILTTVLGIAGSFAAGFVGQALGWYQAGRGHGLHRLGASAPSCCCSSSASSRGREPRKAPEAAPWRRSPTGIWCPTRRQQIDAVASHCRRLVTQARAGGAPASRWCRSPASTGSPTWRCWCKLIPEINRAFGLTPEQVERLAPDRRVVVYKAISAGGSLLVGRLVTRELMHHAAEAGRRAPDDAAGGQVRADRRAGGLGRADLLGAEVRLRAAHPPMHGGVAPAACCPRPPPARDAEYNAPTRGVAQPGSATALGPVGRSSNLSPRPSLPATHGPCCP